MSMHRCLSTYYLLWYGWLKGKMGKSLIGIVQILLRRTVLVPIFHFPLATMHSYSSAKSIIP